MGKRNYETHFDAESRVYTKKFNDENETTLTLNLAELPQEAQSYIEGYGVTQVMNDCHAGVKDMAEMIAISKQRMEDLTNGVIRRRSAGMGIGINLEQLTQALANVTFGGDLEKAKGALADFVPDMENDDEDTVKAKKARLRAIRNIGEVKMEIDRMNGKSAESLLTDPLQVSGGTSDNQEESGAEAQ